MWRSASSGAQATQLSKTGKKSTMHGDIVSIDERAQKFLNKFSIECKNYKTYDLEKFLFEANGALANWWDQCYQDAIKSNRLPLLIVKRNRFQEICISTWTPDNIFNLIKLQNLRIFPFYQMRISNFEDWIK